ncbi:hypothetical protein AVEN_170345-1 [Araneus ventricosus]|uniref:Uncharacterized protein n=1 Tax=Araneus ventricosus TaxID=182803 RepID=A0A4Y2CBC5_ARAVE|nr:hypothetical protein AVEN_170345-1 [Araneus ventricosus]
MVRETSPRQKLLLNLPKHLRKQHSYLSSDFALKMSLHTPYYTVKYPSTTLGTMETRHGNVENKGRLYHVTGYAVRVLLVDYIQ